MGKRIYLNSDCNDKWNVPVSRSMLTLYQVIYHNNVMFTKYFFAKC